METYIKEADETEYENHKFFYEAGINTPPIVGYDYERGTLSIKHIPGYVISGHSDDAFGRDSASLALKLITQVETLHKLGYLHGDLNPSNVIISNGDVFLIDFEFSSEIDSSFIKIEEEMNNLLSLLIILLSSNLELVYRLMRLCEYTDSSRLPFALREDVDYNTLRETIKV